MARNAGRLHAWPSNWPIRGPGDMTAPISSGIGTYACFAPIHPAQLLTFTHTGLGTGNPVEKPLGTSVSAPFVLKRQPRKARLAPGSNSLMIQVFSQFIFRSTQSSTVASTQSLMHCP